MDREAIPEKLPSIFARSELKRHSKVGSPGVSTMFQQVSLRVEYRCAKSLATEYALGGVGKTQTALSFPLAKKKNLRTYFLGRPSCAHTSLITTAPPSPEGTASILT